MVKMSDEEIKNMSPDEIRKMMQKGADLDDKGEPKQKDSSLKVGNIVPEAQPFG